VNSHWTPFGAAVAWTTALDCLEELDPAYTALRRPDLSQVRLDPAPSEFAPFGFENAPTDWAVPDSRDGLAGITEHTATGEAPLDGDSDLMELPARTVAEQGAPHTVLFARDSQGNSVSPWVADSFVSVCHEPHGIDKPDQRMDVV